MAESGFESKTCANLLHKKPGCSLRALARQALLRRKPLPTFPAAEKGWSSPILGGEWGARAAMGAHGPGAVPYLCLGLGPPKKPEPRQTCCLIPQGLTPSACHGSSSLLDSPELLSLQK